MNVYTGLLFLHGPGNAFTAEALFQRVDLVAQRADGEVQRIRRARQVAQARGEHEALQRVQRKAAHLVGDS